MRASQTENVPGDKVGLLNRIFGFAYYLRYPGKALKQRNKYVYYAVKWLLLAAILYLRFSSGSSCRVSKVSTMLELLASPEAWIAFATLTALELVLGIDNVIFISILVDKLPPERREFARRIGLFLAMFMRIGLLFVLSWLVGLTAPLVHRVRSRRSPAATSSSSLGGLFLLWKSTMEIHQLMEGEEGEGGERGEGDVRRGASCRSSSSTSCSRSTRSSPRSAW